MARSVILIGQETLQRNNGFKGKGCDLCRHVNDAQCNGDGGGKLFQIRLGWRRGDDWMGWRAYFEKFGCAVGRFRPRLAMRCWITVDVAR